MRYVLRLIAAWTVVIAAAVSPTAFAATDAELAGNSLTQYPFFEYVKAVNENAPVTVAIDPSRFPAIVGQTCDVYVVSSKSLSQWRIDTALTDVTPGGAQTETFSGGTIQANAVTVVGPSQLDANAGEGLGVPYDVVLDCDQNGQLSDADFIDGRVGEAGFYSVHDTTQPGPYAVSEIEYQIPESDAAANSIPNDERFQFLYFPTDIATLAERPLVIIGHGNGHQHSWYGHIGRHLASYGYIVMSHANDTEPSPATAATTTLGHTEVFVDLVEAGAIASGALAGHLDTNQIVWIGHSRGAEGVVIAYDRLVKGAATPDHFSKDSIALVISMLPTDFRDPGQIAEPGNVHYQVWTAAGDTDVRTAAGQPCCQTFRILDRATGYRQGTVVQGAGHGWFHDENAAPDRFDGPCSLGPTNALTHSILLGQLLPVIKHYVEGNIPAVDFLTRQYERFRPIGVPQSNSCVVVTHQHQNGSTQGNFIIDDYQSNTSQSVSSSGSAVNFDVENVTEGILDDNNTNFTWNTSDPFNGALQGTVGDDTRGVVFDWTDENRFYEWSVPAAITELSQFSYLSFRGAQGTQHPNTLAVPGDLTFNVTLRDASGTTSSINIGAFGGGLEQPYARPDGGHNEMETVRIRLSDFLTNSSSLNLSAIEAIRFNFGPTSGSARGRIVIDDLMVTRDVSPKPFEIIAPTQLLSAFAGTSIAGLRILVRLAASSDYDISPANLKVAVDGIELTPAQIPTAAESVGDQTWLVIAPGPKADGCYDLTVTLTAPAGLSDEERQSICYEDDETRQLDRILAIDQTNSMRFDGTSGSSSTEKMDAARAAAKFYVDLSNANDQIGVISFQRRDQDEDGTIDEPEELAETIFDLAPAENGPTDNRPTIRLAIDDIEPDQSPGFSGPETSPGAALEEARAMFAARGVAEHERNVVLLTDGLENYAPFWATSSGGLAPLRPTYEGGDIRIDTVGVGANADDALLTDIADATGGEFINLNEGSGSFFLLSRLSNWYKFVDEDIRGEQRFYYREGFPKTRFTFGNRTVRVDTFDVEENLDWMTVAFHVNQDDAVNVQLFAPDSPDPVTAVDGQILMTTDPKHSVYRIRKPTHGKWVYLLETKSSKPEFFAVASAPTTLTAQMGPMRVQRKLKGQFSTPIRLWIADKKAVLKANVSGYVRRPDGEKLSISLADNGKASDGAANDGIYGLVYRDTTPGVHFVNLTATGTQDDGREFNRYLSAAILIPGQKKKQVQFGEDQKRK